MDLKEKYGYTLEEGLKMDKGKLLEVFGVKKDGRKSLEKQILDAAEMRRCTKCSSILPLSEFYGKNSVCKKCSMQKDKEDFSTEDLKDAIREVIQEECIVREVDKIIEVPKEVIKEIEVVKDREIVKMPEVDEDTVLMLCESYPYLFETFADQIFSFLAFKRGEFNYLYRGYDFTMFKGGVKLDNLSAQDKFNEVNKDKSKLLWYLVRTKVIHNTEESFLNDIDTLIYRSLSSVY